ncbi:MAG: hypothetical protein K2X53_02285 [Alphaproteobacteria bacterium]|nr:hypothetical protein [Alphaproteobacteria bacterium]
MMMTRAYTSLIMAIGFCFFTFSCGNATELAACKKKINDMAEQGKKIASERGLKGILDKAQIGSLRTSGDKSSLKACNKTLDQLIGIIKALNKKVETEKK